MQLEDILAPGGQLFMVTVTENDPAGIIQQLQSKGFNGRDSAPALILPNLIAA